MRRVLVLDTETGGLDPATCALTEIGAVVAEYDDKWDGPTILDKFDVLIVPPDDLHFTPKALKTQGRSMGLLSRDGIPEADAIRQFSAFVKRNFSGWAGDIDTAMHNSSFDFGFFLAAFRRHGIEWPPFSAQHLCTMHWFRLLRFKGHHQVKKAKLHDHVCPHYGIDIDPAKSHEAWYDCELTAIALGHMMRDLARVQVAELEAAA